MPKSVFLPSVLYKSEVCLVAAGPRVDAACLRTCIDEPFSFLEWYDVLAWWALELGFGEHFETYAGFILSADDLRKLQDQLDLKYQCLLDNVAGPITANRICAALSMYKILPWAFGMLVLVYMLGTIIRITASVVGGALFSIFMLYFTAFY